MKTVITMSKGFPISAFFFFPKIDKRAMTLILIIGKENHNASSGVHEAFEDSIVIFMYKKF